MAEDRKTPEMRAQMTDIERLRHSAAHVLATAILKIWPEAQFAAGPPVENGFYYDVDLPHRISPEDFEKIEAEMKKEIKANHTFERMEVSRDEALEMGKKGRLAALSDRNDPSKFKLDIIENIPAGETISLYRNGEFVDLCAGPHVMRTGNVGAFKLTHVASAYYKGDEKNPQLQRIYGTAFKNKTQLDEYFAMLEEAKKRDHRKLGKELEIYIIDDDVGPGLPLWLPRGAAMIEELEKLAKETEFAAGYQRVRSPHIARESSTKRAVTFPTTPTRCFRRWNLKSGRSEEKRLDECEFEDRESCSNLTAGITANFTGDERAQRKHRSEIGTNDHRKSSHLIPKRKRKKTRHVLSDKHHRSKRKIGGPRSLLPQSDELSASSQVVCGGAAQLSRSAVAASRSTGPVIATNRAASCSGSCGCARCR